jgi:hypothetical protein
VWIPLRVFEVVHGYPCGYLGCMRVYIWVEVSVTKPTTQVWVGNWVPIGATHTCTWQVPKVGTQAGGHYPCSSLSQCPFVCHLYMLYFIQVVKLYAVNNRQSIYYTYSFVVSLPDIAMSLFYYFDYLSSDLVSDHSDSLAGT